MTLWPTMKRLQFLERERTDTLRQLAGLLDENEELRRLLADSRASELRALQEMDRLRDIDGLCAEIEGA